MRTLKCWGGPAVGGSSAAGSAHSGGSRSPLLGPAPSGLASTSLILGPVVPGRLGPSPGGWRKGLRAERECGHRLSEPSWHGECRPLRWAAGLGGHGREEVFKERVPVGALDEARGSGWLKVTWL